MQTLASSYDAGPGPNLSRPIAVNRPDPSLMATRSSSFMGGNFPTGSAFQTRDRKVTQEVLQKERSRRDGVRGNGTPDRRRWLDAVLPGNHLVL